MNAGCWLRHLNRGCWNSIVVVCSNNNWTGVVSHGEKCAVREYGALLKPHAHTTKHTMECTSQCVCMVVVQGRDANGRKETARPFSLETYAERRIHTTYSASLHPTSHTCSYPYISFKTRSSSTFMTLHPKYALMYIHVEMEY